MKHAFPFPRLRCLFAIPALFFLCVSLLAAPQQKHNLRFDVMPDRWDEAFPLGNGLIGALLWQQGETLRMSLDRADLWDLRPTKDIDKLTFNMVVDHVDKNDYGVIQRLGDVPYERDPAPTKIRAAALTFDITAFGKVRSAELDLASATCRVRWENGAELETFVHAVQPIGRFRFRGVDKDFTPTLVAPSYQGGTTGLASLGYSQGIVESSQGRQVYTQEGWGGLVYRVAVEWKAVPGGIEGVWSISSHYPPSESADYGSPLKAEEETAAALGNGYDADHRTHVDWWAGYWDRSSIAIPDDLLEKQWFQEQYKFGSASRRGAPPISLQAVWTADDGGIPPWKGDYHNDLNTQFSYLIGYGGNHLDECSAFTDWLWSCRSVSKKFTKSYFEVDGLNVPGVCTLTGEPMGGWIQYSMSPTTAAWCSHYFYLHWRYAKDREFLEQRAYPWLKEVATYLENVSFLKDGVRRLPLSSSPEYYDNSIRAWSKGISNYDLALVRWLFHATAELAGELALDGEREHWLEIERQWPDFSLDASGALEVFPGVPQADSHRHHSTLLGIHPLGYIDFENGEKDRNIIRNSFALLRANGTRAWVGYSFSWMAGLYARAYDGNDAAEQLRIFASNFCSPNGFHVNGDQKGGEYSDFTYRPFTLEGNFAFGSSLQEMLLQSHRGRVEIFPAVPDAWTDCRFDGLRAEGAFVVDAVREGGKTQSVRILAEKGGTLHIANPFGPDAAAPKGGTSDEENTAWTFVCAPGDVVELTR